MCSCAKSGSQLPLNLNAQVLTVFVGSWCFSLFGSLLVQYSYLSTIQRSQLEVQSKCV